MNELISIIIPIYNVEKYLSECINSVIGQNYNNIEILLIDDGSTDNSGKICDEYKKIDNRIKVYHKLNGGLSDARNYGLDKANGKYVCFVDSDDFVLKDYISSMYSNLKRNEVDIASCGYSLFCNEKNIINKNRVGIEKKYNTIEAHKYLNIIGYFNTVVWNKLYNKKLFNDIRFPIGKKSEDCFIMPYLIEKSNGVYYSSIPKYMYRQRSESITKSKEINLDAIEASKSCIEFYKNNNMNDTIKYAKRSLIFTYIFIYNSYLVRFKNKKEMKKIKENVMQYKSDIFYDELPKNQIIQLWLFTHCIFLYNIVYTIHYKMKSKRGEI